MGSAYFRSYQSNITRVHLAELVEQAMTDQVPRLLSLVGPCVNVARWQPPQDARPRQTTATIAS
jgi:hypothetical protein